VGWLVTTGRFNILNPTNIGLIRFIHFGRIISELGSICLSPAY
jgi:hypothetical protein